MTLPPDNNGRLAGQVVLVTGATRGIGRAIAHAAAREGAQVAVATRSLHQAEALVRELENAYGGHHLAIEMDVTNATAVTNMAEKLLKRYMRIDAIVNNAGVIHTDQLLGGSIETFRETLSTNVGGAFLVTRALIEEMMLVRRGHIINIAGMAGLRGAPFLSAFSASKAALISLTQSWAEELSDYGIRVHAVCPDIVDTPGLRNALGDQLPSMLSPERVAQTVIDLLTGEIAIESGSVVTLETSDSTSISPV